MGLYEDLRRQLTNLPVSYSCFPYHNAHIPSSVICISQSGEFVMFTLPFLIEYKGMFDCVVMPEK